MSENQSLPARPDVAQLRTQAKELLKTLREREPEAKLSQAQFQIARQYGFASWPKFVDEIETPQLIERMKDLVQKGDAAALDRLLARKPTLRKHIDDPLFGFDSPALVQASHHRDAAQLIPVLVRHGADPNVRTKWWAGSFGPLDHARPEAVELLVSLGTKWDVWSASAHGRLEILKSILDENPSLVNAPGGDGQRPLHVAKTPEVAELLIEQGADLEIRDVDHESTPAQYQIGSTDVLRILIERGAKPDIFTAIALDDIDLLKRVLKEDPEARNAHVGEPPFKTTTSNGGHIYAYNVGNGATPTVFAAERNAHKTLEELARGTSPSEMLAAYAWAGNEEGVDRLLADGVRPKDTENHILAHAALKGKTESVRLLLKAGFDPLALGMDSGTALHVAAWAGHLDAVRLLIPHVPLETRDANHGSTPLGWATHGAQWCRNPQGDYPGIVEALLQAGADIHAVANNVGTSILDQAGDREDVKEVLRAHGAG